MSLRSVFVFKERRLMGLGQVRGASWSKGRPLPCHRSISILADADSGVCDGAHSAFVMKVSKVPPFNFAGRSEPPGSGRLEASHLVCRFHLRDSLALVNKWDLLTPITAPMGARQNKSRLDIMVVALSTCK